MRNVVPIPRLLAKQHLQFKQAWFVLIAISVMFSQTLGIWHHIAHGPDIAAPHYDQNRFNAEHAQPDRELANFFNQALDQLFGHLKKSSDRFACHHFQHLSSSPGCPQAEFYWLGNYHQVDLLESFFSSALFDRLSPAFYIARAPPARSIH